jgi:hypothetical protein
MMAGLDELQATIALDRSLPSPPVLIHGTAADLPKVNPFLRGSKANLVVTSPPYPGIHILYHRWQVDGRKETPAPYWIAGCYDGKGAAYYNFADRNETHQDDYFAESLKTSVQSAPSWQTTQRWSDDCLLRSRTQLKYLANMQAAGFQACSLWWREIQNLRAYGDLSSGHGMRT